MSIKKKGLLLCLGVLLISAFIVLFPFIKTQIELSKLKVEDISKIVYVEYEDIPLSSEIKSKKVLTLERNKASVEEFVKSFQEGKIQRRPTEQKNSTMLFLYFKNDKVVNAYVAGNSLGFQYGKYWVELEDINGFLGEMEPVEYVEIRDVG